MSYNEQDTLYFFVLNSPACFEWVRWASNFSKNARNRSSSSCAKPSPLQAVEHSTVPLIQNKVKPEQSKGLTFFRQVAFVNTHVCIYGKPHKGKPHKGKPLSVLKRKTHKQQPNCPGCRTQGHVLKTSFSAIIFFFFFLMQLRYFDSMLLENTPERLLLVKH